MSPTTTTPELSSAQPPKVLKTEPLDIDTTILDSARSSGSLESSASSSANTSLTAPSLEPSLSTSSAASSTDPSPCPSILIRSNSSLTFPAPSPTITFAPLPHTEVRKRNPAHQLGVAARSRLLQHRRMLRERGLNPDDPAPPYPYGPGSGVAGGRGATLVDCFGQDDPVEIREAQAGVDVDEEAQVAARHHRSRAVSDPADDALLSLARLVRAAGKSLRRTLSMRDVRAKDRSPRDGPPGEDSHGGVPARSSTSSASAVDGQVDEEPARGGSLGERPHPVLKTSVVHLFAEHDGHTRSEEGGVWEEEIVEDSWKRLLSNPGKSSEPAHEQESSTPIPKSSSSSELPSTGRTTVVSATARVR